ncbi:barstar family protein [Amycolatopsis cihanbeyliensis]|uniref:barstar family protein n=1 Tax=Amycolatopsis cihanbeyliensis TaxID=1128664 RepID=UPI001B86BB06|nr:barstar family protein [Amycolatopsis cihanbeyliensis]
MIEADFPLYMVVDEDSGDVLLAAEEVDGFFVSQEQGSPEVVFRGVHSLDKGRRRTEDANLQILSRESGKIGEYFIGRVALGDTVVKSSDGKISSVSCYVFDNRCEYPEAARIWRRWALGPAVEEGEWIQLSTGCLDAWLHVVQNSWFVLNSDAACRGSDKVADLDGTYITTSQKFFCALGEAVNGPGGYFGSNLDALADCIHSSLDRGVSLRIIWRNYKLSRESLDHYFLDSVTAIMREFGIDFTAC